MGDRNCDIFSLRMFFSTILTLFYDQCLNCVFSVHAIRIVHDYFIIVTHTLHLSAKNILSCALVIRYCYHLPPLSQVRFLFTNELSASSIVVLCSGQKYTNVSHGKIDIKIKIATFFQKSNQNRSKL